MHQYKPILDIDEIFPFSIQQNNNIPFLRCGYPNTIQKPIQFYELNAHSIFSQNLI